LQTQLVRLAVPLLFEHAVTDASTQTPSALQSWLAVHSDPLESAHWQSIVLAVPFAFGHICTVGQ
jgi:hypothetical protein